MRKTYVKPVISASMSGTLEGVYAYGCSFDGDDACQPYEDKSALFEQKIKDFFALGGTPSASAWARYWTNLVKSFWG